VFGVPYKTFAYLDLGFIHLQVFGLCVAAGVLASIGVASWYGRRHNVSEDAVLRVAPWLVLSGVVGARITYVITNSDELDSFWDAFAIWKGGLQFTGGAILATGVAVPLLRRFEPAQRWHFADALGLGLIIGQAIGRIGCYAVGEHFGGPASLPFGVRWEGGSTREPAPAIGTVFHQTAAYEAIHLLILFVVLMVLLRKRSFAPGVLIGVFCLWYGVLRFLTDFLRVNDRELWGLTGAQFGCLALIAIGDWIFATQRERTQRLGAPAKAEEDTPAPAVAP
jgi:phosphatidylglycerol:prolipoprotein diacylglycerol transferase